MQVAEEEGRALCSCRWWKLHCFTDLGEETPARAANLDLCNTQKANLRRMRHKGSKLPMSYAPALQTEPELPARLPPGVALTETQAVACVLNIHFSCCTACKVLLSQTRHQQTAAVGAGV
ncbi:hypothetical protein AV530_004459 [Patagioenas fasciata monilis]|uniref:Uncharacterized protein n=1 Tax=Patagioenas fasciata monilis TaxID=372326 RepID=A0A1V4JC98_PATFA|nr:hypothetical protein AV530_004459 [Patagioenas fasciata monilis]